MNQVILVGRIGQTPETIYTPSGSAYCDLSLATNSRQKDKDGEWHDRTDWHSVRLWGNRAKFAGERLHKGAQIAVSGELRTDSWEKNGEKKFKTYVLAFNLEPLSKLTPKPDADEPATVHAADVSAEDDDDLPF